MLDISEMIQSTRKRPLPEEALGMSTNCEFRAAKVTISTTALTVDLQDGRSLSVPLNWFPKLQGASAEQLADHRLIGDGVGVHWETLGIDLSVQGLLFDSPPATSAPDGEPERPKRVSYHVVPSKSEWHLKRQGEERFASFENKSDAIQAGVHEARSHEAGQLIIHTKDGRFQEERTYGFDPPESAG